jgi:negative regulator of sigma E activity
MRRSVLILLVVVLGIALLLFNKEDATPQPTNQGVIQTTQAAQPLDVKSLDLSSAATETKSDVIDMKGKVVSIIIAAALFGVVYGKHRWSKTKFGFKKK